MHMYIKYIFSSYLVFCISCKFSQEANSKLDSNHIRFESHPVWIGFSLNHIRFESHPFWIASGIYDSLVGNNARSAYFCDVIYFSSHSQSEHIYVTSQHCLESNNLKLKVGLTWRFACRLDGLKVGWLVKCVDVTGSSSADKNLHDVMRNQSDPQKFVQSFAFYCFVEGIVIPA